MTNPYEFELNGLKVVVYAENKEKAKEIFVQKTIPNTVPPCCNCKVNKACCGCPEYFEWKKQKG